jgi:heptaprenyl diphosphate synthase
VVNVVEQFGLPRLEEALSTVETALHGAVTAEDPFLSEVARHLIRAGGKRLRPALTVAAASVCGAEVTDDLVQGSVAVELVHLGSLYHDDVIDGAERRRGVVSVNTKYGNLVAVLAGDFLLARASEIAASLGTEVAGLLAWTIGQLCEGEVSQLQYAFNPDRPEPAYLRSIAGKTASLMGTSSRVGALVSGAPRAHVEAVTNFGHSFGMAFQICDDIRDLLDTDVQLGKPAGQDIMEGTYTLPVLSALALPMVGDELRDLLGRPLDGPARDKVRDLIVGTSAVATSVAEARRWADRCAQALDPLRTVGGPEAVDAVAGLGHRLIDRLDLT